MRLEVRCCCDPGRLLGTLEVPRFKLFAGAELHYVIKPHMRILRLVEGRGFEAELTDHQHLTLKVLPFDPGADGDNYLAVNSNDVDVALIRQVPGFIERSQHGEEEEESQDQADGALQSEGAVDQVGQSNQRQRQARRAGKEAGRRAAIGSAPWDGAGPE